MQRIEKKKMTHNITDLILQGNANSEVRQLELSLFNKKNYVHLFLASSYFSYEKLCQLSKYSPTIKNSRDNNNDYIQNL